MRHPRAARGPRSSRRSTPGCATRTATRERRPAVGQNGSEPSLDPFIPRRGRGLMLSASDIETYRICPLKYKFARVFRIPQEPTIHQRFGIAIHQVLERFHSAGGGDLAAPDGAVRGLVAALRLRRLGRRAAVPRPRGRPRSSATGCRTAQSESRPVWFERSFAFRLGPHLLRGPRRSRRPPARRQLRADRLQDGQGEDRAGSARGRPALALPDGRARVVAARDLGAELLLRADRREGAGAALGRGARAGEGHGGEIAGGILKQEFEPTPSPEICRFCDYRIICPAAEK